METPGTGSHLQYDLDRIRMIRYRLVKTSTAPYPDLEASCDVILRIKKSGKGIYTIERTSSNWTLAGANATFRINELGELSDFSVSSIQYGYLMNGTGEWVDVTIATQQITGSSFYQEIPLLPGIEVSTGDVWNGSYRFNGTTTFTAATMNSTMISFVNGTHWCEAGPRRNVQCEAGSFTIIEVVSHLESVMVTSISQGKGTRPMKGGPFRITSENIYEIDIETGLVISATTSTIDESMPNLIHKTILEAVEIVRR